MFAPCQSSSQTNRAFLINFLLSSDAEILLLSTRLSMRIGAKTCKDVYAMCTRLPTELPFCIPTLVVGFSLSLSLSLSPFVLAGCRMGASKWGFLDKSTHSPRNPHSYSAGILLAQVGSVGSVLLFSPSKTGSPKLEVQ